MKRILASFVLFLCAATLAIARQRETVCGSGPGTAEQTRLLHEQNRRLHAARQKPFGARAGGLGVRTQGDLVLMDAQAGVVSERNPFNLDGQQIEFQSTSGGYQYRLTSEPFDFTIANRSERVAGIGDDDTREFALPFPFRYFGETYTSVWLNSDGNLTFGVGDPASADRSLGRFASGAPRIAAFYSDLDPSVDGRITVFAHPDRFTVSWIEVPEFRSFGIGPRNTLQLTLWPDGRVTFSYGGIGSAAAVVGISRGRLQGQTSIVSFATQGSRTFESSIAERFALNPEIDITTAAQRFYQNYDDAYDYLVIYNTLGIPAAAGAVAFEVTARNDRTGYGDRQVDNGLEFGSRRRLQAVINMGPLGQYPADPNARVPARFAVGDTPLSILAHEAGHLYLAFASVRDPANPEARPMLGAQNAHWSTAFNSEASLLEGARIRDNGPEVSPRFETVATVEGFSALDQYLMGLRGPEEVPPTFLVTGAILFGGPAAPGIRFSGQRREVTVEELIEAEGRRTPDATVAQRRFRFAFIVVGPAGGSTSEQLAQIDRYRTDFEPYFARVTEGRASADTRLRRALQFSVQPAGGVLLTATAKIRVEREAAGPDPVVVRLQRGGGGVDVPQRVTIPAGAVGTEFVARGVTPGVTELIGEAESGGYETAFTRIQTRVAAGELRARIISGNSAQPLNRVTPVRVAAADLNNVPYPGVTLEIAGSGVVNPGPQAVTDSEGGVTVNWRPDPEAALNELRVRVAGSTEPAARAVALGAPFVAEGGLVNAASGVSVLCPGLVASIYGANLDPNAQVFVGDRRAEVLFASDTQLNVILPADLDPGAYPFRVRTPLGESAFRILEYARASPGIFAVRREEEGRRIRIWATGLGLDLEQVEVRIGPFRLAILSILPGTRGVTEIQAELPGGLQGEVELRAGGVTSNRVPVTPP